jgi:hypothetical protein
MNRNFIFLENYIDEIKKNDFSFISDNDIIVCGILINSSINRKKIFGDLVPKNIDNHIFSKNNIKCLRICDMHDKSFINGLKGLAEYCKKVNLNYLITTYNKNNQYNKLEKLIQNISPKTNIITVPHCIDKNIFKDYNLEKTYDILLYGVLEKNIYKFRCRLVNLNLYIFFSRTPYNNISYVFSRL